MNGGSHEATLEMMQLFAEEVMPDFREDAASTRRRGRPINRPGVALLALMVWPWPMSPPRRLARTELSASINRNTLRTHDAGMNMYTLIACGSCVPTATCRLPGCSSTATTSHSSAPPAFS